MTFEMILVSLKFLICAFKIRFEQFRAWILDLEILEGVNSLSRGWYVIIVIIK